jgi:hypothetical protein
VRPGETRAPRTPPPAEAGSGSTEAPTGGERPAPAKPVIPPTLRRNTPPGGTSAVRPGDARAPRPPESGALRDGPGEADGPGWAWPGNAEPAPRKQPWLFGRQRPTAGDPAARPRRRFPWSRSEPLADDDDEDSEGDAHDALETLRPLGFARRTSQSFRRPRLPSFGRNRRPAFPPGRELPAAPAAPGDEADADNGPGDTDPTG